MADLALAPGSGFEITSLDDLDTYLGAVAAGGFSSVGLRVEDLCGDVEGAHKLLDAHNLRCVDLLALLVSRRDEEVMARAAKLAAAAGHLGCQFVQTLLWTRVSEESIDRLGRCGDLVKASGARMALEMPPVGEMNSLPAVVEVLRTVGFDRASLLLDTFHFNRGTSTWDDLETFPLEAMGYVQFDDALPAETDDIMHETMDRRTMPGDGEFDLHRFASTLTSRGWSGVVSVEVLSAELRMLDVSSFAALAYSTTVPYWT